MNDGVPQNQQPASDTEALRQSADKLDNKLTNAAKGVDGLAANLDQVVEKKIQHAEQKLDTFLGNLDNFLGKF